MWIHFVENGFQLKLIKFKKQKIQEETNSINARIFCILCLLHKIVCIDLCLYSLKHCGLFGCSYVLTVICNSYRTAI